MAIEFVVLFETISRHLKLHIGVFRLIGDLFALIAFYHDSNWIFVLGLLVLIVNVLYIGLCVKSIIKQNKI